MENNEYKDILIYKTMSNPNVSFEFFPPKSEAQLRRFWRTLGCLQTLNPSMFSMTWGALGAASQASLDILEPLVKESDTPITAHLSCAGETRGSMLARIARLEALGITRFLALRGDIVKAPVLQESAATRVNHSVDRAVRGRGDEQLMTHASDLVALLAENSDREISVAAYPEVHPESPSVEVDTQWLKHKLDAGANKAITQFFFDADTFLRFRDRAVAAGVHQTLVPGILPIHDIEKVQLFSEKCGANVPSALIERFTKMKTSECKRELAVDECVSLCEKLQTEGVNDFHIYTLNQAEPAYAVASELVPANRRLQRKSSVVEAA